MSGSRAFRAGRLRLRRVQSMEELPEQMATALAAYERHLSAERNLAAHTVRAYVGDVLGLLRHAAALGHTDVGSLDLRTLRSWLANQQTLGKARSTMARRATAVRVFTAWAQRTGRAESIPPHHSASRAGILGGGSGRVRPGDVSKAPPRGVVPRSVLAVPARRRRGPARATGGRGDLHLARRGGRDLPGTDDVCVRLKPMSTQTGRWMTYMVDDEARQQDLRSTRHRTGGRAGSVARDPAGRWFATHRR